MQCPNCSGEIKDTDKICPTCKKVLRLECPICSTLNTRKVCEKCGYVILSKCVKCSKINPTINQVCANCGTSTYSSVLINSSKLEEFAVLTFDFVNLDKIGWSMGDKRFKKFLEKLRTSFNTAVKIKEVTLIRNGNNLIVGFNKDESFALSVENAIKTTIKLLSLIAKINQKITKYSNEVIKCAATVSKMASYSDNVDIISFLDLYKDDKKKLSALTDVHLYLEAAIYSVLQDKLEYTYISSVYKNKREVMLFNINVKKYIVIYDDPQLKGQKMVDGRYNLPEFKEDLSYLKVVQDRNAFNKNLINIKSVKCNWEQFDSYELKQNLFSVILKDSKFIVSCSAPYEYSIPEKELISLFEPAKEKTIKTIVCTQSMKGKPYGFWKKFFERIYNFQNLTEQQLEDIYKIQLGIEDRKHLLKYVINQQELKDSNSAEVHDEISKAIFNIVRNISNVIFHIKNFEFMDETSKLIFEQFINNFESLSLSWIVELNQPQKLHEIYKPLLVNPKYYEITMLPMPFSKIIQPYLPEYKQVMDSFYINRIALCARGSLSFVDAALSYLRQQEIFIVENGNVKLNSNGNVIIPASLDDLLKKRIFALFDYTQMYEVFAASLLFDDILNMKYLKELFPEYKLDNIITYLKENGYLYSIGTDYYISSYNQYLKIFMEYMPEDKIRSIATLIMKSSLVKQDKELIVRLNEICQNKIDTLNAIIENIDTNMSLGDYYALLHSMRYFLYLIKKYEISDNDEGVKEKKEAIFSELISNARHFNPDSISDIIAVIANKLKKESLIVDLISVYLNIFESCLSHQNYVNAFQYLQKIFSLIQNSTEAETKFSDILNVLYMFKVELLLNLGYFKSAIELGFSLINQLEPNYIAQNKKSQFLGKEFNLLFNTFICNLAFMVIMDRKMPFGQFEELLQEELNIKVPSAELFNSLELLITDKPYSLSPKEDSYNSLAFSSMLYHILNAFLVLDNPEEFANRLYNASLVATNCGNLNVEYFCTLMIAYSYTKLENIDKAKQIIKIIQEKSAKQNLSLMSYLTCYFECYSNLNDENKLQSTFEMLSSILQKIESDDNVCIYLNVCFKRLMGQILELSGDTKKASYYFETAKEMLV